MAARSTHPGRHHAPDQHLVPLHDESRRVRRVLRAQDGVAVLGAQPLHALFTVDQRDDDVAIARRQGPVDDHHVLIEQADALHAVAAGLRKEGLRRVDVEQLV